MNIDIFMDQNLFFEGRVFTNKQYNEAELNHQGCNDHMIVYKNNSQLLMTQSK